MSSGAVLSVTGGSIAATGVANAGEIRLNAGARIDLYLSSDMGGSITFGSGVFGTIRAPQGTQGLDNVPAGVNVMFTAQSSRGDDDDDDDGSGGDDGSRGDDDDDGSGGDSAQDPCIG